MSPVHQIQCSPNLPHYNKYGMTYPDSLSGCLYSADLSSDGHLVTLLPVD